ncbi:MAG: F0F1 ATP synthase subunit delta [bacterium]|nr:F0F1 ATP synthase subunit delta [bacterium]
MKYTTRQYAHALYGALRDAKDSERQAIMRRFYAYIVRNRDQQYVGRILEEVGKIHSNTEGLHTVSVESVSPLSSAVKKQIEHVFGGNVILHESIHPKLFAGIKFIIDGDTVIDASGAGQLRKLFKGIGPA